MTSLLYYNYHISAISDEEYDQLARELLAGWDTFEHQHKYLVTKEDLQAGTLYLLGVNDYPMLVRQAAELLRKEYELQKSS